AAGQIAGIGGLESRVGHCFTRTVRGNEVLQHVQTFAEVGRDGRFDDFAGWPGHQATHTGELADLLFRTARAGVGHDVNRVEITAGTVVLLHGLEHFFRDALRDLGPDFDDFVVLFAAGDGTFLVLFLHLNDRLLRFIDKTGLFAGDDHIVNTDRDSGARGVQEAQR